MPEMPTSTGIESVLQENRIFKPSKEFSKRAQIKSLAQYRKLYNESIKSPGEILGQTGEERTGLVQAVEKSAAMERAVRQMVRRRPD